jgi:hypothetical protein
MSAVVRILWDTKLRSRDSFLMILDFIPACIDTLGKMIGSLHPAGGAWHVEFIVER